MDHNVVVLRAPWPTFGNVSDKWAFLPLFSLHYQTVLLIFSQLEWVE